MVKVAATNADGLGFRTACAWKALTVYPTGMAGYLSH